MDVAKAKNVIIVLLISFNVFLLVNNLIYHDGQGVGRETLENAKTILRQRGVILECSIPSGTGGTHKLKYGGGGLDIPAIIERLLGKEYDTVSDGSAFQYLEKKIVFLSDTEFVYTDKTPASEMNIIDESSVRRAALEFMKDNGLLEGEYVLDDYVINEDGSRTLYYIENYGGLLIFDNCFSIVITEKGVTRLEYRKRQIKGFSADVVEYPEAYQALLVRFRGVSDLVITGIDSGYRLDEASMDEMESIELLPVWRIKVKGASQPLYISSHDTSM